MPTTETTEQKQVIIGSFRGAFSRFQEAAMTDLKAAGFDQKVAHLIADDYGADIGNAVRNGSDFGTKIAKAKKDGIARISLTGKGETTMSNTMSLLRVCQQTSALVKEGLLAKHTIDRENLSAPIRNYVARVEARAKETQFGE